MRDRPVLREEAAVIAVRQKGGADDRQSEPGRPPGGLDDQEQKDRSEGDVGGFEQGLPIEEGVIAAAERIHRIKARDHCGPTENPVGHGRLPVALVSCLVRDEDQRKRHRQEDDQVELAALGERAEHLPERQDPGSRGDDRHPGPDAAAQLTGRPLLVVEVNRDRIIDVQRSIVAHGRTLLRGGPPAVPDHPGVGAVNPQYPA